MVITTDRATLTRTMCSRYSDQRNIGEMHGSCLYDREHRPMDVKQKMSNNNSPTKKLTGKNCSNKPSGWEGCSYRKQKRIRRRKEIREFLRIDDNLRRQDNTGREERMMEHLDYLKDCIAGKEEYDKRKFETIMGSNSQSDQPPRCDYRRTLGPSNGCGSSELLDGERSSVRSPCVGKVCLPGASSGSSCNVFPGVASSLRSCGAGLRYSCEAVRCRRENDDGDFDERRSWCSKVCIDNSNSILESETVENKSKLCGRFRNYGNKECKTKEERIMTKSYWDRIRAFRRDLIRKRDEKRTKLRESNRVRHKQQIKRFKMSPIVDTESETTVSQRSQPHADRDASVSSTIVESQNNEISEVRMRRMSDNRVPPGLEKGKNFETFESCASASLDEQVSQRSTARADLEKFVLSHKIPEVITVNNDDNTIHEKPKDATTTDKVSALTIDESTPVGD